jgi:large subunit ribosomal protein L7/L12
MAQQAKIRDIVDQLTSLSFMDLVEVTGSLAAVLREKGIDPFPAAAAPVASQASVSAEVKEEQSLFSVVLTGFASDKKLAVIKEVRAITALGLKEGKDLVESAPGAVVKTGVDAAEAADIKAKLEASGATVELK